MNSVQKKKIYLKSRRCFLKKSALLGAGVATAVIIPTQVMASVKDTAQPKFKPKKEEGYRMTQHIADYYKSTQL